MAEEIWRKSIPPAPSDEELRESLDPVSYREYDEEISDLEELMDEGRIKLGIAKGRLLEMDPDTKRLIGRRSYLLARIYEQEGNYEKARKEITLAVKLCPQYDYFKKCYDRISHKAQSFKKQQRSKKITNAVAITAVLAGFCGLSYISYKDSERKQLKEVVKSMTSDISSAIETKKEDHYMLSFLIQTADVESSEINNLESIAVYKNGELIERMQSKTKLSGLLARYKLEHNLQEKGRFEYRIEAVYSSGRKKIQTTVINIE